MRNISFFMTVLPLYRGLKTHTRRVDSWQNVKPGELLCGAVKCQGLKPREPLQRLRIIRVIDAWKEPLDDITPEEVSAEGFPGMSPAEFCKMFTAGQPIPRNWDGDVTVIKFGFVPGGRFPMPGICSRCFCSERQACTLPRVGPCWWVTDLGQPARHATSLCSFCFAAREFPTSDAIRWNDRPVTSRKTRHDR